MYSHRKFSLPFKVSPHSEKIEVGQFYFLELLYTTSIQSKSYQQYTKFVSKLFNHIITHLNKEHGNILVYCKRDRMFTLFSANLRRISSFEALQLPNRYNFLIPFYFYFLIILINSPLFIVGSASKHVSFLHFCNCV